MTGSGGADTDATALAEAFRAGRLDPVAGAPRAGGGAAATGATFLVVDAARARREAEAARARIRAGQPASPLDGVPIAWKDLFDAEGLRTTAGTAIRREAPAAARDAPLVARAARAGLVFVGKTNLSELAFSGLGLNPHFGTPRHPTLPDRVPGGSSSGSAVAVADGIVPLAIGTDTGGSVRIPAAFTGLVGFRPSIGRYPLDATVPLAPSFDTAGPFARSVRDVAALDRVLSGMPDDGPDDGPDDAPAPAPRRAVGLRFVVDEAILADERVDPLVRAQVRRAIDAIGQAGGRVEPRPATVLHDAGAAIDADGWLGAAEAYTAHEALVGSGEAALLDPTIRARLERGGRLTLPAVVRLYQSRDALRRRLLAESGDALFLLPAVGVPPPPLAGLADPDTFARVNLQALRLTMIGSLLGMPGLSLPLADGIGLLVAGPDGSDRRVLAAARLVEACLRG